MVPVPAVIDPVAVIAPLTVTTMSPLAAATPVSVVGKEFVNNTSPAGAELTAAKMLTAFCSRSRMSPAVELFAVSEPAVITVGRAWATPFAADSKTLVEAVTALTNTAPLAAVTFTLPPVAAAATVTPVSPIMDIPPTASIFANVPMVTAPPMAVIDRLPVDAVTLSRRLTPPRDAKVPELKVTWGPNTLSASDMMPSLVTSTLPIPVIVDPTAAVKDVPAVNAMRPAVELIAPPSVVAPIDFPVTEAPVIVLNVVMAPNASSDRPPPAMNAALTLMSERFVRPPAVILIASVAVTVPPNVAAPMVFDTMLVAVSVAAKVVVSGPLIESMVIPAVAVT